MLLYLICQTRCSAIKHAVTTSHTSCQNSDDNATKGNKSVTIMSCYSTEFQQCAGTTVKLQDMSSYKNSIYMECQNIYSKVI